MQKHKTGQPAGLAPGIYLNLSMEDYHRDPAIGSSGIKNLKESPDEYWYDSPLNPDREEDEPTAAKIVGQAYHTMILEPAEFEQRYTIKPKVKTSSMANTVGEGDFEKLVMMEAALKRTPTHHRLLIEGYPEVSVFWQDEKTGLMCKIRFDRFNAAWIADLKTTEAVTDRHLRRHYPEYGYEISGAMYSLGANAAKKAIRSREGFYIDPKITPEFIDAFLKNENQIFAFVFQQKKLPFTTRCWLVSPYDSAIGKDKFEYGLQVYLDNIQQFGTEQPWPSKYQELENVTEGMVSAAINY